MNIPFFGKIFIMAFLISLACGYSFFERQKYEAWRNAIPAPILQFMPAFQAQDVYENREVSGQELLAAFDRGLFIHFWGTWCAPCEAELPELIDFAKHYEDKDVGFVFLAVKDDEREIRKFLRRFSQNFPNNIRALHDKEGASLKNFGTFKLPETYLFAKDSTHLKKFIGPQSWGHPSYIDQVNLFLERSNVTHTTSSTK